MGETFSDSVKDLRLGEFMTVATLGFYAFLRNAEYGNTEVQIIKSPTGEPFVRFTIRESKTERGGNYNYVEL